MKHLLLLTLIFISASTYCQDKTQDFEPLDLEKVRADIDTIKQQMDSTFYYIKATYDIILFECQEFGVKKTIQMNKGIFFPLGVFLGFYLLWLRNRKRF